MLMNFDNLINKYDLKIRGVIHIGAHYGQEYGEYINHNIKNIMFFEPLKNSFKVLLDNIQLSNTITAYNIALGNMTGEVKMFVETANQGMSSSILEPLLHLQQYPGIVFDDKEIVKIDKLDNIKFNKNDFNMINIDVQGYELEVFKGSIETLGSIDIVYTEVNRDEVYKDCGKVNELDDFLGAFGLKRIITSWDGRTWGDALYLKR